ncbi:hypothetical protein QFC22_005269 [Naganishia vaughanmartiniae]|uniref:Uncharacterized protein n=1 Tax=Naganishia vaughanmartiniae TaxID=1424756 RepID=A0ACC2WXI7_9TREE|nr:hypothetical protein QFC22_005269 [Naganishia vaughanmartiniae]
MTAQHFGDSGYTTSTITSSATNPKASAPRGSWVKPEETTIDAPAFENQSHSSQRASNEAVHPRSSSQAQINKKRGTDRVYWFAILFIALGSSLFAASSTSSWPAIGQVRLPGDRSKTPGVTFWPNSKATETDEAQPSSKEETWIPISTEESPVEAFISNINAKLSSIASLATASSNLRTIASVSATTQQPTGLLAEKKRQITQDVLEKSMPALGMTNEFKDVVAEGLPAWAATFQHSNTPAAWYKSLGSLDLMRFITWSLFFIGTCILAFLSNPDEGSFRKYLAEESFRKHVQDLYHPPTPATTAKPKRTTAGSVEDGADENKDGTGELLEGLSHASDVPTPFRFSNHVSIHLRTPAYKFRNLVIFSLVAIMPKSTHTSNHGRSHSAGIGRRASIKNTLLTPSKTHLSPGNVSSGVSSEADENGPQYDRSTDMHALTNLDGGHDPMVAGVWFIGAFGRWWSMGAISISLPMMDAKRTEQLFRWIMSMGEEAGKKKRLLGKSGVGIGKEVIGLTGRRVGGEEAGLLGVVALPSEEVEAEAHLPQPPIKTIITPARSESPPPLRPDASLPLHNREAPPQKSHSQPTPKATLHAPSERPNGLAEDKKSTGVDLDSPALRELTTSLTKAQAVVKDYRDQLVTFNNNFANSQAQLQTSVDELRKKKRDDDADRADLKVKMRGLEENKRQAEGTRREAEKKLRSAEAIRDAILARIEKMKVEIGKFKQDIEDCNSAIQLNETESEDYRKATREEMEHQQRMFEELEDDVGEEARQNTELAAKVVEAVDALQALIDNSPRAIPEGHGHHEETDVSRANSNPTTPDVAQFPHRLQSGIPGPFNTLRDQYANPFQYPPNYSQNVATQATTSILREPHTYRNASSDLYAPPTFRDLSGFEGFGPLGAPIQTASGESGSEDPGSPLGNMSSSFTANLLPQELFRSLEGDQTPSESKMDLADPWDNANVESTQEEEESATHLRPVEDKWALPTPKATSPANEHASTVIDHDLSPEETGLPALDAGKLSRAIRDMDDAPRDGAPRRWFSSTRLNALDTTSPFSGYAPGTERHSTLGFPLGQTTSNESLPLPGSGYNNAFAPSAAEKKTLRWSSLGKWGGLNQGRQETSTSPFATSGATSGGFVPEGNTGRSISAEHNARSAWEHARVDGDEAQDGGDKKPYRFFSLGRRGKDGSGEPDQGNSIWKS